MRGGDGQVRVDETLLGGICDLCGMTSWVQPPPSVSVSS
jgi:hypothetical protein